MSVHNRPIIHPYVGIALGIIAVSAASIIVKMIQNENVPSLVISAYRLTIASLVLSPLSLTRHRDEIKKLTRRDLLLIAVAGIFLALHFATWIESIRFTTIASSTVLVSTSPIFVGVQIGRAHV